MGNGPMAIKNWQVNDTKTGKVKHLSRQEMYAYLQRLGQTISIDNLPESVQTNFLDEEPKESLNQRYRIYVDHERDNLLLAVTQ